MVETTTAGTTAVEIDPDQLALYRRVLRAPINEAHAPLYSVAAHLLAAYDAVTADRDQLRRQLDAAEAAPCSHDGTAFDALERLHGRIKRDLPGDGSDVQEPAEPYWARTLDDLLAFADKLYMPLADAARGKGAAEGGPQRGPGDTEGHTRIRAPYLGPIDEEPDAPDATEDGQQ